MKFRLCGGTFFTLYLQTRNSLARSKNFKSLESKYSDSHYLEQFIKIACPNFTVHNADTFKTNVSEYKSCQKSNGMNLPFDDIDFVLGFDDAVKNHYPEVLKRVYDFMDETKEKAASGRTRIVATILELIDEDDTIPDDAKFYVKEGGSYITKKDLCKTKKFVYQSFILGVWHYIVTNIPDNKVGRETYLSWHTEAEEKHGQPLFKNLIVDKEHREIFVSFEGDPCSNFTFEKTGSEAQPYVPNGNEEETHDAFNTYIENVIDKYSNIKTLLYSSPKDFYSFYVPNDITELSTPGNRFAEDREVKIVSTPDHYVSIIDILRFSGNYVILTGTGGIGKSMMMRHLLLSTAKSYSEQKMIPVLVQLKDYDGSTSLADFVFAQVHQLSEITMEQFREKLIDGDVLLLLDGLDEVKSECISELQRQLDFFVDKFSHNAVIISSRPIQNFVAYQRFIPRSISPFNKEQALHLIDKLEFRPDEPSIKNKFREEVDTELYDSHRDFVENPLLLTIMLLTFEEYASIPYKMHIFYKEAFDTLAQKHDANKGAYQRQFKSQLSSSRLFDYMSEFCARTYKDEKFEFSDIEFTKYFNDLKELSRYPEESVNVDDFKADLLDNLCLLYAEGGKYHFTHRSFQEYFCAAFFAKQKDKHLKSIGEMFEEKHFNRQSDQTFPMLYDMIPDKVEEYIFLPYLKNMFSELKTSDYSYVVDKLDEDCPGDPEYLEFLAKMYPLIMYASGDTDSPTNCPESYLYSFIIQLLGFDEDKESLTLTGDNEFLEDDYVYIETFRGKHELHTLSEINTYDDEHEDLEVVGHLYSFSVNECLTHFEDHQEVVHDLLDENFELYKEYYSVKRYLKDLKSKQRVVGDDFFDQF